MLAYVFWHTGPGDPAYEEALSAFHTALADGGPPGFHSSFAYAVDGADWLPAPLYEDWYLVDGWADLGPLNDAAVDARRRGAHDAVALAARRGAGGVYLLRSGEPEAAGPALWLHKRAWAPRAEILAGLALLGSGVWERQLVLGPAPEFCVVGLTDRGGTAGGTLVQRRRVS
jgi:hypothetical protein